MAATPQLRRELGLADVLALAVGVTIGAGIFAMPGRVAGYFSSFSTIAAAWVAGAAFAFTGSLIYAELGARLPHTGGEYVYLHRAFGPLPAFLCGWSLLLVGRTTPTATLTLVFAEYASSFVPISEPGRLALAATTIIALGAVNYFGLRAGKRVQAATTAVKVGSIVVFVAASLPLLGNARANLASAHVPTQQLGEIGNVSSAMLLVIFAYVGWDRAGYLAGETHDPQRNLPRALALGAAICAFLYLSMNVVYHSALPISTINGSRVAAADVARLLWGPAAVAALAAVVMISTSGAQQQNIMASSRVYYAMAQDGLFFAVMGRVHPRWRSPHVAIVLHCGWSVVLLLAARGVTVLASAMVFCLLICYGAVTLAYFKFRRQQPAAPFLAPGYPWLPALYLAVIVALTATNVYFNPRAPLAVLAVMAAGFPFYYLWRRRR